MQADLKERLNAEIRAEIAAIDRASGPLRARVARASETIIRMLLPRAPEETSGRKSHEIEERSHLVNFSKALPATAHDAQASVLAEFTRNLLETDFRRDMTDDGARPFSYLVSCVRNRAIELWRVERSLERRHESAASDAALTPNLAVSSTQDGANEDEEVAEKLAEITQRVPAALQMLNRDELLLLLLSAVLRLQRDRIGEVLGTTPNTVGQRLLRLRDRLHVLVHDGVARAPDPRRARGGKASARKQAATRGMCGSPNRTGMRNTADVPPFSNGEQVPE